MSIKRKDIRTWITTIGQSENAITSPLWAACKLDGYVPDRVVLMDPGGEGVDRNALKASVAHILRAYGVGSPEVLIEPVDDKDFASFKEKLRELVDDIEGEVAVDITPGRRLMAAFAMEVGLHKGDKVKKIYYLPLGDRRYYEKPFMLIPARMHNFTEVKELLRRDA